MRTSHLGMAFDPVVFDVVRAALDRQQLTRASRDAAPDVSEPLRPAVNR